VQFAIDVHEQASIDWHPLFSGIPTLVAVIVPTLSGMTFFKGFSGMLPFPRVPCLLLSWAVVALKSASILCFDMDRHLRRGRALPLASLYKKQLAFEALLFMVINAAVLLLIFYVPPVGQAQ